MTQCNSDCCGGTASTDKTKPTAEIRGIDPVLVEQVRDRDLPDAVATRLATFTGRRPDEQTMGAFVDALRESWPTAGHTPTIDDLCTTDSGPSRAHLDGETYHFQCVQDALLVPLLREPPVTVTATSPLDEATISVEISADEMTVDPSGAVASFGVATNPAGPVESIDEQTGFDQVCPYTNLCHSRAEYDRYVRQTDEAALVALSVPESVALGHLLVRG
jgi:hypothetical protein